MRPSNGYLFSSRYRAKSATEIHILADKLKADRHMENIMVGEREVFTCILIGNC